MSEDAFEVLMAARKAIVERLIAINAEHLSLESRRAGLGLELGAREHRPDADVGHRPHEELLQLRAKVDAALAALDAERDELSRKLEAIVERLDGPTLS